VKGGVLGDGIHHEEWSNNPIDEDAKADLLPHLPVGEELVERFISHFAEDGIHHDE
jgi:hypothetical protein